MKRHIASCAFASVFAMSIMAGAHAATPKVGVAAAVKNTVQRVTGGASQPLSVGSDLFTNERIRTGEDSIAQILLLDKTSLTVGPRAELTLDKFVYNPSKGGTGQVVLNAVQGAFRFVSGSQNPRSYTIKTPIGVIGVRGTIGDLFVSKSQVILINVQGVLSFTYNGVTYTLSKPGQAYIFGPNGQVQGPMTWDGSIISTSAGITLPLYGTHFQGEPNPGQLDYNIGNIDQLGGIIQRGLTPPAPPPCNCQ